jgi:hypothetical protein
VKLRRDILLFGALALLALASGWWLLANRPGAAIEAFARQAQARPMPGHAKPISAGAFRATLCAASPCVLVEAGGLSFVIGAGEGAAEGLLELGLLREDIDAIVLPDLKLESLAGLPGLARASLAKARREAIKVYGPSGIVPVVDGINLMLSGDQSAHLQVGAESEDQGLEGVLVFDSGVVALRAFGGSARGEGRVYRVDFEGKSLLLAGCGARPDQIVSAARGTRRVGGVLAAAAPELLNPDPAACLTLEAGLAAANQAKLEAVLLGPLLPSVAIPGAAAAWREVLASHPGAHAALGEVGAVLDLSGEAPVFRKSN